MTTNRDGQTASNSQQQYGALYMHRVVVLRKDFDEFLDGAARSPSERPDHDLGIFCFICRVATPVSADVCALSVLIQGGHKVGETRKSCTRR